MPNNDKSKFLQWPPQAYWDQSQPAIANYDSRIEESETNHLPQKVLLKLSFLSVNTDIHHVASSSIQSEETDPALNQKKPS